MNVFDELNGYDESLDDNLGFFKKIKKAVKSGFKSVRRVTSKVGRKVLPSEIRRIGRDIDKSGALKIAAGAALLVAGVPAIGALGGSAGTIGSKALALAGKGITTVKSSIGALKFAGAAKKIGTAASVVNSLRGQKASQQAAVETKDAARRVVDFSQAVGASPEFAKALKILRAQGYTDEQILQHWQESKTYYLTAVPQVAEVTRPTIYSQAVSAGMPPQYAEQYADEESVKIAKAEVSKVASSANLLPVLGLGIAAMLMVSK